MLRAGPAGFSADPAGPDGEDQAQARGQARNARGEPTRIPVPIMSENSRVDVNHGCLQHVNMSCTVRNTRTTAQSGGAKLTRSMVLESWLPSWDLSEGLSSPIFEI